MTRCSLQSIRSLVNPLRELTQIAYPIILSKLGVPLRGIFMTYLFAKLGPSALASSAVIYSLMTVLLTFFLGVLMPSSGVLVAYALGENKPQAVSRILQNALYLGVILSLPTMLLLYHIEPLLIYLGQPPTLVEQVAQFAKALAWIFIPQTMLLIAYKLWINLKKSKILLLYTVSGLSMMICACYLLAFGCLGLPALGVAGVGWGIALTYVLQVVVVGTHISFSQATRAYHLYTRFCWPNYQLLRQLWQLGWPMGCKNVLEFSLLFILALLLGKYQAQQLPLWQLFLQLYMLTSCLSSAVSIANETLMAQALGAKQFIVAQHTAYAAIALSLLLVMLVVAASFLLHQRLGVWLLPTQVGLRDSLVWGLLLIAGVQGLDALRKVFSCMLVVCKQAQRALWAESLGLWGLSLPGALLFGIYYQYYALGLFWALLLGATLTVSLMAHQLKRFM